MKYLTIHGVKVNYKNLNVGDSILFVSNKH